MYKKVNVCLCIYTKKPMLLASVIGHLVLFSSFFTKESMLLLFTYNEILCWQSHCQNGTLMVVESKRMTKQKGKIEQS